MRISDWSSDVCSSDLAVAMIDNPRTRVIDASTAYRTDPGWTYGFPELERAQGEKVKAAKRVSNPGCYPTGAIALLRPLVDAGLLPQDFPVTVNAVSDRKSTRLNSSH